MLSNRTLLEHGQHIAVLDDDHDALEFFKTLLKPFSNCTIEYFDHPTAEFCNYVWKHEIDLFIMDVRLRNFENGIKLTEDIICKQRGSLFLFVSGYDYDERDFENLEGRCVYDFLHKPLDITQFVIVTSTLLNIAGTYKTTFKSKKFKPKEDEMDEVRRNYMKQIEADRILIERLRKANCTFSMRK